VEFEDEDGNKLLLEVLDTFFYNGEEFAVLGDVEEDEAPACECGCAHEHHHEHGEDCDCEEHGLYIMKIETSTDENGDEIEEFVPVEDAMMDALIEIVQTRFSDDGEDDEEDGE
jgi:hypothetical protein